MVDLRLLEDHLAVIAVTTQFQYLGAGIQKVDRRQKTRTLDTVTVKTIGRDVRGGHQHDPLLEQTAQQTGKDHRVAYVHHMEFVQTQQAPVTRHARGNDLQGIGLTLDGGQLVVDQLHKTVKVKSCLRDSGQLVVEKVHQPGLAAPDTAPDIQPLDRPRSRLEETFQALRPGLRQFIGQSLQRLEHAQLVGIGGQPLRHQAGFILGD